jgi:hypothetical protein
MSILLSIALSISLLGDSSGTQGRFVNCHGDLFYVDSIWRFEISTNDVDYLTQNYNDNDGGVLMIGCGMGEISLPDTVLSLDTIRYASNIIQRVRWRSNGYDVSSLYVWDSMQFVLTYKSTLMDDKYLDKLYRILDSKRMN